jgi:catechol 2,3-dioxygenase-like lactoylglutathione lyase family enzyme
MKLDTVRLLVDDMPAAVRFYRDVMGFKLRFGGETDVYVEFEVGAGEVAVALFEKKLMLGSLGLTPADGSVAGDRAVLTFAVPDVDESFATLVTKGAVVVHSPTDQPAWHLRVAHLRDPAGNLIEIHSALRSI